MHTKLKWKSELSPTRKKLLINWKWKSTKNEHKQNEQVFDYCRKEAINRFVKEKREEEMKMKLSICCEDFNAIAVFSAMKIAFRFLTISYFEYENTKHIPWS